MQNMLLYGILAAILIWQLWLKEYFTYWNLINIQINGYTYKVRDRPAAELLAKLHQQLKSVIQQLHLDSPNSSSVQRLVKGFTQTQLIERPGFSSSSGTDLSEGQNGSHQFTSYTVNKGQKIVFCLRQTDGTLVDPNTLMFVGLHELAHIMTERVDDYSSHNAEFWKNYEQLLRTAQTLNLYRYHDYKSNPVEYCGFLIE